MKRFIFCMVLSVVFLLPPTALADVTGKVVDGSGKPVFDAMVTYADLKNRLIYCYSDSNGNFKLVSPDKWDPEHLDLRPQVSTKPQRFNVSPDPMEISVKGSFVSFYVASTNKVSADIFSLNGRSVRTLFRRTLGKGSYSFNPFAGMGKECPWDVCVLRIINGTSSRCVKVTNFGRHAITRGFTDAVLAEHPSRTNALLMAAAVDSIRVGKTSFQPSKAALSTYNDNVGTLVIRFVDIEKKVDSLLALMSQDVKIGQTTQGVDTFSTAQRQGTIFFQVHTNLSFAQRINSVRGSQQAALTTAMGIPLLFGADAVHGFGLPENGTIFPHNIGLACTRNPELVELAQRITAIECKSLGVNWTFAPYVEPVRNELHGRTNESWDETPEGTALFSRAAVRGFQGTDLSAPTSVAATAKHFAGGGGTEGGKTMGNCNTADHETLCKIHFAGFKAAVAEGVATVMPHFCQFEGVRCHENKMLLTDTLKTRWKWSGFVAGDYEGISRAGATVPNCVNAGLDNPMAPQSVAAYLKDLRSGLQSGTIPGSRLDDMAGRIIRVKYKMDLFANPNPRVEYTPYVKSAEHRMIARMCVRKSIVCLKNDMLANVTPARRALPLLKSAKIHIIGEHADNMRLQCHGWTLGWPSLATATTPSGVRIRGAFESAVAGQGGSVTYSSGASNIPSNADVIVVAIGEDVYAEDQGDAPGNQAIDYDNDTRPWVTNQRALVNAAKATGRPVVILLLSGRPLIITNMLSKCDAFVEVWQPGPEGNGVSDVLFGDYDFAGRLSHTWPSTINQIPINANNPATGQPYGDAVGSGGTPLFPYGFGLNLKGEPIK